MIFVTVSYISILATPYIHYQEYQLLFSQQLLETGAEGRDGGWATFEVLSDGCIVGLLANESKTQAEVLNNLGYIGIFERKETPMVWIVRYPK